MIWAVAHIVQTSLGAIPAKCQDNTSQFKMQDYSSVLKQGLSSLNTIFGFLSQQYLQRQTSSLVVECLLVLCQCASSIISPKAPTPPQWFIPEDDINCVLVAIKKNCVTPNSQISIPFDIKCCETEWLVTCGEALAAAQADADFAATQAAILGFPAPSFQEEMEALLVPKAEASPSLSRKRARSSESHGSDKQESKEEEEDEPPSKKLKTSEQAEGCCSHRTTSAKNKKPQALKFLSKKPIKNESIVAGNSKGMGLVPMAFSLPPSEVDKLKSLPAIAGPSTAIAPPDTLQKLTAKHTGSPIYPRSLDNPDRKIILISQKDVPDHALLDWVYCELVKYNQLDEKDDADCVDPENYCRIIVSFERTPGYTGVPSI
ncbi:hypothetical protein BDP27DRAFT_1363887 [Rhodocollybia butyracea]|uniref:Uncharacterized protein n=1 Tax=Rhodocollybia butyracea TaxID=206335 RepID=A0A9P5U7G5_9AGAR|nr:hypothetical protein BDP27DRAFT_1363887 [Rhodocollybia butyracea]